MSGVVSSIPASGVELTDKTPEVGAWLLSAGGQPISSLQVFDPVSAWDTGEYTCEAQNGYGMPMRSEAVRMEAGEQGSSRGLSSGLGWGPGSAFHPGFGGVVSHVSEPSED